MEWLNYHHLLYFWTVASEGSVTKASKKLRLAQPTISGQIRALEESLGEQLFAKQGRHLVLTDVGRFVYGYADEIFGLGRDLLDALAGRTPQRRMKLHVGVAYAVPKLVTYRLLEPVLDLEPRVDLVCTEDRTDRLLAELAIHELDLVLSDEPIGGAAKVRAFNHLLGETGITFFALPELARRMRPGFPGSLEGAPLVLPATTSTLRRTIDHWLDNLDLRPEVVAELEDSALIKVFGEHGAGVFPGPTIIEQDVRERYGVEVVGRAEGVRERFYAITVERRITQPAVAAITEGAREELFGQDE